MTHDGTLRLTSNSGRASVEIDEGCGARLSRLCLDGLDVLVGRSDSVLHWGCYSMVPWAGRVREGRFEHEGIAYALPLRMPPHAIHGTVLDRAWQRLDAKDPTSARHRVELGPDWPFAGQVEQTLRLRDDGLEWALEVSAERDSFPASIGWHPWFRRELGRGGAAVLDFEAEEILVRGEDGLPSGERAAPPPGPWDDCFASVSRPPRIRWPGALEIELTTDLDYWVVYDEPEHALCVEPLSAPPNALNGGAARVTPETSLIGRFQMKWSIG